MADIFISSAPADQALARSLALALQKYGLSVWWDRDAAPDEAARGVQREQARYVLALWTEAARRSPHVGVEAGQAAERGKLVVAGVGGGRVSVGTPATPAIDLSYWDGSHTNVAFKSLLRAVCGETPRQPTQPVPQGAQNRQTAPKGPAGLKRLEPKASGPTPRAAALSTRATPMGGVTLANRSGANRSGANRSGANRSGAKLSSGSARVVAPVKIEPIKSQGPLRKTLQQYPAPQQPHNDPRYQGAMPGGSENTGSAMAVYVLYLVSLFGPIPFYLASGAPSLPLIDGLSLLLYVVGFIIALASRNGASPWLSGHFTYQIRTFWMSLVYLFGGAFAIGFFGGIIGGASGGSEADIEALIALPLILLVLFWTIWFAVRCIKGVSRLSGRMPLDDPRTWFF